MKKCIACGFARLMNTTETHTATVGGYVVKAALPAVVCKKCGESYVEAIDLERFELAAAQELARRGACVGEVFKFMRKAVGLKAADLGSLLGVAPETVSRWETGKVPVDRAAFVTLAALVSDRLSARTETLDRLQAVRRPLARRKAPIQIKLAG
jgi:putative zinc finger/helix-turn-helix YgiT family protein